MNDNVIKSIIIHSDKNEGRPKHLCPSQGAGSIPAQHTLLMWSYNTRARYNFTVTVQSVVFGKD